MNQNKENNHFEDETQSAKEPLTKRIARFSAFIYLGLAITVVIVATVGIFSISYDYDDELPSVSIPEIDYNTDFSVPEFSYPTDESSKTDEKPVGNEESNVDAEIQDPDENQEPLPMFYRPVKGEIIKPHSMDALVFSETMGDYRAHAGIDIAAEIGTPVLCFADGTVAAIEEDYFFGMTVTVTHADGAVSYYKNLDTNLAENIVVGAEVLAGQELGAVGTTARIESSDQPHLHFELTVNGALVNPEPELPVS